MDEFEHVGVSYAANDVAACYGKGTEAVIIGGGSSAGQAAMFLWSSASCVRIRLYGHSLASSISDPLSSRLMADAMIEIEFKATLTALRSDDDLATVTLRDPKGGTERRLNIRALFRAGAGRNTNPSADLVALDGKGRHRHWRPVHPYATSPPGAFGVADVRPGPVKRVASSLGEGSVVISHVLEHVHAGKKDVPGS